MADFFGGYRGVDTQVNPAIVNLLAEPGRAIARGIGDIGESVERYLQNRQQYNFNRSDFEALAGQQTPEELKTAIGEKLLNRITGGKAHAEDFAAASQVLRGKTAMDLQKNQLAVAQIALERAREDKAASEAFNRYLRGIDLDQTKAVSKTVMTPETVTGITRVQEPIPTKPQLDEAAFGQAQKLYVENLAQYQTRTKDLDDVQRQIALVQDHTSTAPREVPLYVLPEFPGAVSNRKESPSEALLRASTAHQNLAGLRAKQARLTAMTAPVEPKAEDFTQLKPDETFIGPPAVTERVTTQTAMVPKTITEQAPLSFEELHSKLMTGLVQAGAVTKDNLVNTDAGLRLFLAASGKGPGLRPEMTPISQTINPATGETQITGQNVPALIAEKQATDLPQRIVPGYGIAASVKDAETLKAASADLSAAQPMFDELLKMTDVPALARPFDRAQIARANVLVNALRGNIRTVIVGPGQVSTYEQKLLEQTILNPTKMLSYAPANKAGLEGIKSALQHKFEANIKAYGLQPLPGTQTVSPTPTGIIDYRTDPRLKK